MKLTEAFDTVYIHISSQLGKFLIAFFVTVLLTYGFLYAIDFIPETPADEPPPAVIDEHTASVSNEEVKKPAARSVAVDPLPTKIIFDQLNKEITILNPTSDKIADLDAALLNGAVRHPDSADFKESGNIFILGHSSYLPTVFNKNFQAFNGIQDLSWGNTIRLQSSDTEYLYRVEKVYKARANEVTVPLDSDKPRLTLATCNSFGSKDDRFVVEAALVDSYPIGSLGR